MPFLNKLKKFYRDNHESLIHLTKADSKVRKAVNKLMMEDLSKTYAAAFAEVLEIPPPLGLGQARGRHGQVHQPVPFGDQARLS